MQCSSGQDWKLRLAKHGHCTALDDHLVEGSAWTVGGETDAANQVRLALQIRIFSLGTPPGVAPKPVSLTRSAVLRRLACRGDYSKMSRVYKQLGSRKLFVKRRRELLLDVCDEFCHAAVGIRGTTDLICLCHSTRTS